MRILSYLLMQTILQIISKTTTGLERDDPSRLRKVELRPRSEEFADLGLTCTISHNDPDDQDKWNDEEVAAPGSDYNYYSGKRHLEMGLNQPLNLRYTVDFVMFYQELGVRTEVAIQSAEIILARIHHAFLVEGQWRKGAFSPLYRADDFGHKLISATRCVKRYRILPQGSDEETFFKAKMWLQFETLYEPVEQ